MTSLYTMRLLNASRRLGVESLQSYAGSRTSSLVVSSRRTIFHFGVCIVPEKEEWLVERFGRFNRVMKAGIRFAIPIVERIPYTRSLKEMAVAIPSQHAITVDNVTVELDGVLYAKIIDSYKASYGIDDVQYAITQMALTTMRSEIGKMTLDCVFKERESLNANIVMAINHASGPWGIECLRYEIKDVIVPERIHTAMTKQMEAERDKRAVVLKSEAEMQSAINCAEGKRQAAILEAEGIKTYKSLVAEGEAISIRLQAQAQADQLKLIYDRLNVDRRSQAPAFLLAEKYIANFGNLAKTNNTMIVGKDVADVASMVGVATNIYKSSQGSNLDSQTDESSAQESSGKS